MSRCQRRKLNLQVKRDFQRWLLMQVGGAVLLSAAVAAGVLYFYARQEVGESFYSAHVTIRRVSDLLLPVILAGAGVSLLSGILMAIFIPQKIAGPIYRIEEELRQLGDGDLTVQIRLRQGDILMDFADTVNNSVEQLRGRVKGVQDGLAKEETAEAARQELARLRT